MTISPSRHETADFPLDSPFNRGSFQFTSMKITMKQVFMVIFHENQKSKMESSTKRSFKTMFPWLHEKNMASLSRGCRSRRLGARWCTMHGASSQSWNMKWIFGPQKAEIGLGWLEFSSPDAPSLGAMESHGKYAG